MQPFHIYCSSLKEELNSKIKDRLNLIKKINKVDKKISSKNYSIIMEEVYFLQDILHITKVSIKNYNKCNPKI